MYKRKLISVFSVILIPIIILLGFYFLDRKYTYVLTSACLILAMVPFFMSLENGKIKAREIVTIAAVTAIAVASRTAFYALPQVKPMCAVVILAASVFGPQVGFLTGALSMLLSNFVFGQGMWTPFQMFAMGMCGLLSPFIFKNKKIAENRFITALFGGIICFFVYGSIADLNSVLMMARDFSLGSIFSIYMSGIAFNAIHAVTTFAVLLVIAPVFREVLERVRNKYGIFIQ